MKNLAIASLIAALALMSSCKNSTDAASSETETPSVEVKRIVTVLQSGGGANTPRVVALIGVHAKKIGITLSIDRIIIKTDEDVQHHRFIGSPTVRIDGLDIDPSARSATQFGFTGRLIDWMQDASSTEKILNDAFSEAGWIKVEGQ